MSLQTGDITKETGTLWETEGDTSNRRESEMRTSSNANLPKCSVCQSTFRRPEHLKRHFRSHTKEKPFECTQCGRHFSRTDTLHRHELSHHTIGAEGGKDHAHRITVKTFRACFNCATARVRCSGGMPCGRCDNRSLECKYPTARRSKAKTRREASQKTLVAKARDTYCQDPQASVVGMDRNDSHPAQDEAKSPSQRPSFQMTQFQVQVNGPNTFNVSPQSCTNSRSRVSAEGQSQESQTFQRSTDTGKRNSHLQNVNKFENVKRMPISPYARLTHQACPSMSTYGKQGSLSTEPSAGINDQFGTFQSEMTNSDSNFGMSANGNRQAQMGFSQPILDTSMQSINWLPSDLYSGAANNPQSRSGLSSQSNLDPVGFLDGLPSSPWLAIVNGEHTSPSLTGITSQTPSGIISFDTGIENPNQLTQAISDGLSHSSPGDPTFRSRYSYVDGAAANIPKYSLTQRLSSKPSCSTGNSSQLKKDSKPVFGFRLTEEIIAACLPESSFRYQIQSSTYTKIHSMFFQLCCTENFIYQKFESAEFPTAEILANFIHFYFDSFQPVYPILHPPTFDPNECHWLVTLAISAIGCHVVDIPETEPCTVAFHEFLRRAINVEKEKLQSNRTPLWLLQAMLLNCVGLLYGDNERTRYSAFSSFADLCSLTSHEKLLGRSDKSKAMLNAPLEQRWILWIEDEIRRRTGYCIWLVDCTVAYHFDRRPLLTLDDVQAALPSEESLWQANSSKSWKCLLDKPLESAHISLYDAVHMIYIEKKLVTGVSEFSYILLIHALYHLMWEVGDSFHRPLSFWNPTAKKLSRETAIPSGSVWLPGIPSYSKWRNSSCDCLDILHWIANSTVAQAAGLEHPTVVHLHVSRLVLLAPFREIRSLVTSLALGKIRWPEHKRTIDWHYIWRWIKHDQYKARLAIIHAGATLWHVQRYSTNAFHEPGAVFLAVLTLWAYGYCSGQMKQAANPHVEPDSDQSFIHLDRPCEDESVQIFVRKGQAMKGTITGIEDICGPDGPEKILRIGCELLAGLTSWGISKRFMAILTSLVELVARNSMTTSSSHDLLDGMAMDLCK